jgi:hypothetical protein
MFRTVLLAIVAAVPWSAFAFPFTAETHHPRIFINDRNIPVIGARVGIADTGLPPALIRSWKSHEAEWEVLQEKAWEAPATLELPASQGGDTWSKTDARKVDRYLATQAVVYVLTQGRPEGAQMAERLRGYLRDIVEDSRDRNGGSIGRSIRSNDWGKNAVYKGFCMAYDYLHPYLMEHDPQVAEDYARWLFAQGVEGYESITSLGTDISDYKHYYNYCWMADGAIAPLLTIWGDVPDLQADLLEMIDYALDFKWEDYQARELNYCGTYSGYREERVEEDLVTAALIRDCLTSHDPFEEFSYHLTRVDDWVMYMTRPDIGESDETGDSTDLGPLQSYYRTFVYISADATQDAATLWFLDTINSLLGEDALDVGAPWVFIIWNDKTLSRLSPALGGFPESAFFGDLTYEDGRNSQYAHFRSNWSFGSEGFATVMASFLCGPLAGGHDLASNGHFAVFRGGDILTASTGVYDGTAFDHTSHYYEPPISENTVLVYDPDSPYAGADDSWGTTYPHTEGMQAPAPNSTGGRGNYVAEDPFNYLHSIGHVTKFAYSKEGHRQVARLESDLTDAYPNTQKPDLWAMGQTVHAVLRDFLFLAGRYFVVYDRINATGAQFKKSIVIHSPDESMPRIVDGTWNGGVQPHPVTHGGTPGVWSSGGSQFYWDKGQSRLFITSHLPAPESGRRVLAIGGTNSQGDWNEDGGDPSFEFWLRRAGENYTWTDQYLSENEIEDEILSGWAGWWRLEIEPSVDSKDERFLTLLEPTSKLQSTPTPSERIPSDAQTIALSIADPGEPIVIALPRGLETREQLWYDYDPQGALPGDSGERWALHVVDGLGPGSYAVSLEGDGAPEVVHRGATTDDGLLVFRAPGRGTFRVEPEDFTASLKP